MEPEAGNGCAWIADTLFSRLFYSRDGVLATNRHVAMLMEPCLRRHALLADSSLASYANLLTSFAASLLVEGETRTA